MLICVEQGTQYFFSIMTLEKGSNSDPVTSSVAVRHDSPLLESKNTQSFFQPIQWDHNRLLSVHPAAPVEVTWCGLYLLQLNSEETKRIQSYYIIIFNFWTSILRQHMKYWIKIIVTLTSFSYICHCWWCRRSRRAKLAKKKKTNKLQNYKIWSMRSGSTVW